MEPAVYVVIPAKDEASRLPPVLHSLRSHGYKHIIVVNDGSTDDTAEIAKGFGCTVISHLLNLGSGAATQTGIDFALSQHADYILTMDADGQHAAEDVRKLIHTIQEEKLDIVIGSRFKLDKEGVPLSRIWFNKIANWVTWLITGVWVTDSQSGMKIMTHEFAKKVEFHFNGFEFCTELFHIIHKDKASYSEVPIKAIYTPESMEKGQNFWVGFQMFFRLLLWRR